MFNDIHNVFEKYLSCSNCPLCETRNNIVLGEGPSNAPLLYVGEGPGEAEDRTGRPFLGEAGQLLIRDAKSLMKKAGITEDFIFFTNVVACRPFYIDSENDNKEVNRAPTRQEMKACYARLCETIYAIDPALIIAGGKTAFQFLVKSTKNITKVRGELFEITIQGVTTTIKYPVIATLHPAYLLRNPDIQDDGCVVQTIEDFTLAFRIAQEVR